MSGEVFDRLIGQDDTVAVLSEAAAAASAGTTGMTHSWLFTGPPGSGRSVAARAFAAALQCPDNGCGRCSSCRTVLGGTHADVTHVVPDGVSIGVSIMRGLVSAAQRSPGTGQWQVLVIEDADRLTEAAGNALLKSIEEPPARTVFLLCAPSANPAEISVTIRSRCRLVPLRQPSTEAVARLLETRDGVDPGLARLCASAAQGHVGRAKRLAIDPQARERRDAILGVPRALSGIGACFTAADALMSASESEATDATKDLAQREVAELETALGKGGTGKGASKATRGNAGQIKELERRQKMRLTRAQRDTLDRALVDLAAFYRDVLVRRLGAHVDAIHLDSAEAVNAAAARWSPESIVRRIDAILQCRTAIDRNVRPRIAVETMMLKLWQG